MIPAASTSLMNQAITDAEASGVLCLETLDKIYLPPYTTRLKAPDDWEAIVHIEMSNQYAFYSYIDILNDLEDDDDSESDDNPIPIPYGQARR